MTQLGDSLNKFIRRWFPYALSIVAIGAVIWYLKRSALLDGLDLRTLRWGCMVLVVLAEATAFAFIGMMLAVFVAQAGVRLSFIEWYGLAITSALSNLIMPISGGIMARAGYLKLRYRFPVSRFSALFAASYLIIFLVSGIAGLAIFAGLWLIQGNPVRWIAAGLLAVMAITPAVLILTPMERLPLPRGGQPMRWLHAALDGWRQIRTDPLLLAKQVGIAAMVEIVQAASLYLSLLAIGKPVPFLDTLLMGVLATLTNFVRITPGALGVRESVTGLAAELVGFSAAQGIAAALVSRLARTLLLIVLGPIFTYALSRFAQASKDTANVIDEIEPSS